MLFLKRIGEYDNTLIVFMSDNGAAGEDFYNHPEADFLRSRYDNSLENMGSPTSFVPTARSGRRPERPRFVTTSNRPTRAASSLP